MQDPAVDRLFRRYPRIFTTDAPHPLPAPLRRFDCPAAWLPIVDALCEALQRETDENAAPQLVAACVKQTFGTLRFQALGPRSERQDAMIDLAGRSSSRLEPGG